MKTEAVSVVVRGDLVLLGEALDALDFDLGVLPRDLRERVVRARELVSAAALEPVAVVHC